MLSASRYKETNVNNQMRFPQEVLRKLQAAIERNVSVYTYGATGFGKTSLVEQALDRAATVWISGSDTEEHVLQRLEGCNVSEYIVLDDLHCMESAMLQKKLVQMVGKEDFRMVMIGRAPMPAWVSALTLQTEMVVISEDDLRVTEGELSAFCASLGLKLPTERVRFWIERTEGNAMALNLLIRRLRQGEQDGDALAEDMRRAFMDYLDEQIISHWSRSVQTFLMQLSLLDAFTLELAQAVTGDDDAALLLSRAEQAGNILSCAGGEWRIRPVLLETLRRRAVRSFGQRRCSQLMYNAGRYYELSGQTLQALAIYRQCGEEDGIFSLLVREARKHAGVGNYWALRQYYQALSDADIQREPVLMTAMSVLYSVLMNAEKSEYWYARLREYAANAKGNDRSEANAQIAYLDIVLPHRGSKDLVSILKTVSALLRNSGDILRPVSLTNNQPSLMNGGKDFCEWSKNDLFLAKTLGPVVERMLGKAGVGLVQAALGESAYAKGEDRFVVLSRLTKAQNQSENNGILEMTWVSVALQARLALSSGDVDYAQRLANGMLQRAERESSHRLAEAVNAFSCWLGLHTNQTSRILAWMENAPDETVEFCTLNRYLYLVKIYGYIALGKHTDALVLLQRMLLYADYAHRTYIRLEYRVLGAVILRRMGQPWKESFIQTLKEIGEYHFVPILSEKGAAVLPLLMEAKTIMSQSAPQLAEWFAQVMEETSHMSRLYPNFLKGMGVDVSAFSETALQVLRMQAAGYTAREIADQLHITQRTVKYHASENYRKLDAKNLVDAVQIAQTLHIL